MIVLRSNLEKSKSFRFIQDLYQTDSNKITGPFQLDRLSKVASKNTPKKVANDSGWENVYA